MRQVKMVLASASPRRKALLQQIGIEPEVMASDIEEIVMSDVPERVVEELSRQKAEHVWERCRRNGRTDVTVLGSDTVVSAGGRILGKPKTEAEAAQMIGLLQGGCHQVYTGVTIICAGARVTFSEKTDVYVYPMTEAEIAAYVAAGESMDKAGAYGIQGRFSAHIRRIEGSYTNVMGLPVGSVYQHLRKLTEEQDD